MSSNQDSNETEHSPHPQINVAFFIGEGGHYQAALDDLMKTVKKELDKVGGYSPQALFPVDIRDDGGSYYAIQQWKWYT